MIKPIPQGYKQTKVGVIPEDWEVVKLLDIVTPINRIVNKPEYGYWKLGLRSHGKGTFHKFIEDPSKIAMDVLYQVENNDLVVNITFAWEHAIAVANIYDEGKLVSHRFPTYMFKQEAYCIYYKYYILQHSFKMLLENISPGGAGRNRVMNKTGFLLLPIIKPSLEEQIKIAEILTVWDDAIAKQEQLIKQKKLLKKGLMQQIFSQKLRFKDDNGNNYPAWETKKLKDICIIKKGVQLSRVDMVENGCYPVLNGGLEYSGYTNSYNTNEDTITISEGGNSCGVVNFINCKFWSGGHCYALINILHEKMYLYHMLKYNEAIIMNLRVGSGLPNIQKSTLEKVLVPVPSLPEQTKIANFLTTLDDEITKLTEQLKQLQLQKKALMQQLLTGKVRVKV